MAASDISKPGRRPIRAVKLIVLTRNFGHQHALSAGLFLASGDYIGVMDADLQDEPEVLIQMCTRRAGDRWARDDAN